MENRKEIIIASFAAFLVIGFLMSALGPALYDLAIQTGHKEETLGVLFTALSIGLLTTQSTIAPLTTRFGQHRVISGGAVLLTIGIFSIVLSQTLWLMLAVTVLFGLGFGLVDTGSNILIAKLYGKRSISGLNLLHMFFGIGATVGPATESLTLEFWDSTLPALWLGGCMALGMTLWLSRLSAISKVVPDANRPQPTPQTPNTFSYRVLLLWMLSILLLIYLMAEIGMGAWTTTYVERVTTLSRATAALGTTAFWLALTIGRIAGVMGSKHLTAYTMLGVCVIGGLGGSLLLLVSAGNAGLTILAVFIIGFFFGPPYPTIIAITTDTFHNHPGKAASVVAATGSIGGVIGPWFQGTLIAHFGESASAIYIALICGAMVLLYLEMQRHGRVAQPAYGSASSSQ